MLSTSLGEGLDDGGVGVLMSERGSGTNAIGRVRCVVVTYEKVISAGCQCKLWVR